MAYAKGLKAGFVVRPTFAPKGHWEDTCQRRPAARRKITIFRPHGNVD